MRRSFTSGTFMFTLDGSTDTGYVKSVDGGAYKGEVAAEQVGPDFTRFKHITTVDIEPISLELGMAVSNRMIQWIGDSWQRKYSRRNGSILHGDFKGKVHYEQQFKDALITETTFPALDATDKNPAYMNVKFQPETLDLHKSSGDLHATVGTKQKLWTPASFMLLIDGLDCSKVSKIESFSVKQKVKKLYYGGARQAQIEPTGIEFPDLNIEMSLAHADDFIKWHKDYVMSGARDMKMEKEGEIIFYNQSMMDALLSVKLKRVGICGIQLLKSEAMAEQVKKVKVSLYCDSMAISPGIGLE